MKKKKRKKNEKRKKNKVGIPLEANPALTTDFQHQLRIAKKLIEYADHVVTTEKPDDDPSRTDHQKLIAMALGGKGFRTFSAMIDLLEKGYADDAAILSRALYECSLVAIYLLDAPEQVVEDYSDYFMYRNWRDHKLFSELDPTTAAKAFSPDYLNTMQAQYESVADRYPDGPWTNLSIEAMAIAVDKKIPNGFKVFAARPGRRSTGWGRARRPGCGCLKDPLFNHNAFNIIQRCPAPRGDSGTPQAHRRE
jgi:Family of unknown function (DUF5677)